MERPCQGGKKSLAPILDVVCHEHLEQRIVTRSALVERYRQRLPDRGSEPAIRAECDTNLRSRSRALPPSAAVHRAYGQCGCPDQAKGSSSV